MGDVLSRARLARNFRTTDPLVGELLDHIDSLDGSDERFKVVMRVLELRDQTIMVQRQEIERLKKIEDAFNRIVHEISSLPEDIVRGNRQNS